MAGNPEIPGPQRPAIVNGLLLLNKPAGMTSNQALQKVKRLLKAKKAGHTGSLDPAATGMLPLCFGEATKICAYLLEADKTYRVTARLGEATDTGDADGEVIQTAPVPDLSPADWEKAILAFVGHTEQIPPMYSALKKDGKRLYELARKGEIVERKARPVRIDEISLLEVSGTRLVFRVSCAKGTYIRTLVEDIAKSVGTVAHTARLHRETVGSFRAEDMLDMSGAERAAEEDLAELRARLLPADAALPGWPECRLDGADTERFCGGQAVASHRQEDEGLVKVYGADQVFLGIGELTGEGLVAPRRIFKHAGAGL
jgi:tRNA pseudouridine55 synthase